MLGSPALMLGRTLQIKVTEDINIQSDVWEVCTQQKGKWLWAESRVWRLWGSTVNIDMEQAGEQGSLGPVSSHFLGGGSEEVLQDTAIYQLSLPQTIPSLWEERTSVSICLGLCCGGISCTFSQEAGLGTFDFSQGKWCLCLCRIP